MSKSLGGGDEIQLEPNDSWLIMMSGSAAAPAGMQGSVRAGGRFTGLGLRALPRTRIDLGTGGSGRGSTSATKRGTPTRMAPESTFRYARTGRRALSGRACTSKWRPHAEGDAGPRAGPRSRGATAAANERAKGGTKASSRDKTSMKKIACAGRPEGGSGVGVRCELLGLRVHLRANVCVFLEYVYASRRPPDPPQRVPPRHDDGCAVCWHAGRARDTPSGRGLARVCACGGTRPHDAMWVQVRLWKIMG